MFPLAQRILWSSDLQTLLWPFDLLPRFSHSLKLLQTKSLDSSKGMLPQSLSQVGLVPTSHLTAGKYYSQESAPSCELMSAAPGTEDQEECGCFRLHFHVQGQCFGLCIPCLTLHGGHGQYISLSEIENLTACLILLWELSLRSTDVSDIFAIHVCMLRALGTREWRILTIYMLPNLLDHQLSHVRNMNFPLNHLRNANLEILLAQVMHFIISILNSILLLPFWNLFLITFNI